MTTGYKHTQKAPLCRDGRILRIGTDDAGNLAAFLDAKISGRGS